MKLGGASTGVTELDEPHQTDEALLSRVATRRDVAAFEVLYGRYAGFVKGALIRSGASAGEADEAMQEAMLSIWRRAESFDPAKATARTWIFAIARNRRIDQIRRQRRPEPDPNDPHWQPDPEPTPEAVMAAGQRDAEVRAALAALSEEQREAVRLAFFVGLSHSEIAARIGVPTGTVKSRIRLAGDRLRAALGDSFVRELFDD